MNTRSEIYTNPTNFIEFDRKFSAVVSFQNNFDQKFSAVVSFQNENSAIETSTIFVMLPRRMNIPKTLSRGRKVGANISKNNSGRILVIGTNCKPLVQLSNLTIAQQSDHFWGNLLQKMMDSILTQYWTRRPKGRQGKYIHICTRIVEQAGIRQIHVKFWREKKSWLITDSMWQTESFSMNSTSFGRKS